MSIRVKRETEVKNATKCAGTQRSENFPRRDRYTQESDIRAEEKSGKNSSEQECEEIIRPISKHHFFKYSNPWSMNPQKPLFAKQTEFKVTIVITYIALLNRAPVFSQNDSLLELQALNLGLFVPIVGLIWKNFHLTWNSYFHSCNLLTELRNWGTLIFFFLSQIFMIHQQIISDFSFFNIIPAIS